MWCWKRAKLIFWDFDNNADGNLEGASGFAGGLTGVMLDGVTDYEVDFASPSDPPNQNVKLDNVKFITAASGGATIIENAAAGDPIIGINTGEFLFHTGLTVAPEIEQFDITWTVFNPASQWTYRTFQQLGGYIGSGDQDNYLKIVAAAKDGGMLHLVLEDNAKVVHSQRIAVPEVMDGSITDTIKLTLSVDKLTGLITPVIEVETASGTTSVTGEVLDATGTAVMSAILGQAQVNGTATGLAAGLFSSASGADTFQAEFAGIEVTDQTVIDPLDPVDPPEVISVTLQAEDAVVEGLAEIKTNLAGAENGAYVDYKSKTGDALEWTVDAGIAGETTLSIRYGLASATPRDMALEVNGVVVVEALSFTQVGTSWTDWGTLAATIDLVEGENTIRLVVTGDSGPNVDAITLTGPAVADPGPEPEPELIPTTQDGIPIYVLAGQSNANRVDTFGSIDDYFAENNVYARVVNSYQSGTRIFPQANNNDWYPFEDGDPGELYETAVGRHSGWYRWCDRGVSEVDPLDPGRIGHDPGRRWRLRGQS